MELIHTQKSFWKINDYPYNKVVEIEPAELQNLVVKLSRADIIEWLMWNDNNGVYSDESSLKEFGQVMSLEEGIEILMRQVEENRVVKNFKVI
jgi:hypothetical protein